MTPNRLGWARPIALITALAVVASCGLPKVGPNKRQIFSGSVQQQGDAFVVQVNDHVTRATAVVPALGFSADLQAAGPIGSDTIRPGDVLGLTIWENVDDGLLASEAQNATMLETVQVDGTGFIFVPYAGRIKASGNSPEALRRIITERLEQQTPEPHFGRVRHCACGRRNDRAGNRSDNGHSKQPPEPHLVSGSLHPPATRHRIAWRRSHSRGRRHTVLHLDGSHRRTGARAVLHAEPFRT